MQVMTRTTRNLALLFGSGLATIPALAGTPVALDFVPTDSDAVLVIPQFGEFLSEVPAMNAVLGEDGMPMLNMIAAMIRGMPGIDLEGSAAGVLEITRPNEHDVSARGVVLVPVTDFAEFSKGHAFADGLFKMPMGETTLFFRQVSEGYAAVGDEADRVRDFDGAAGRLAANGALVGKAGGRMASGNDLFVYLNFDAFGDEIAKGQEQMESQGEMVRAMGGDEAGQGFDAFIEAAESMANDGSVLMMGLNFDDAVGMSFDIGVQFAEGSTTASYLQNDGDAGKYFSNVPAMDYFFANAFDLSGSGVQAMMKDYFAASGEMDAGVEGFDWEKMLTGVNGGVQVVGASDNIMGGLLNNTLHFIDVDEPGVYMNVAREAFAGINGGAMLAAMDDQATSINDVDAYGFNVGADLSSFDELAGGFGAPSPTMILGLVFGPAGGPDGYFADVGGGVVSTFTKDAGFFASAVAAADGKGTLLSGSTLAQSSALLPDNRIYEGYFGAGAVMNTVGPMLMMFGILPEFEPIESMAPVGFGMTADGGGVMFRTVVPMQVLDVVSEMMPERVDEVADGEEDVSF